MAVLCGRAPKKMQCNFDSNICKLCPLRAIDSPGHVLFECPALQEARESTWPKLLSSMPPAMVESINEKNYEEKSTLIVSCYGGTYIPEWDNIYHDSIKMVHVMYKKRFERYALENDDI